MFILLSCVAAERPVRIGLVLRGSGKPRSCSATDDDDDDANWFGVLVGRMRAFVTRCFQVKGQKFAKN